jgi:hypothetical protein
MAKTYGQDIELWYLDRKIAVFHAKPWSHSAGGEEQNFVVGVGPCEKRKIAMCEKCEELDNKIERYRNLIARVADPQTHEGVGKLIEVLQAQKVALHPERET